ncbi:capping protein-inhibiting regulator of actin dynamics [Drosophila takahashii]|uniref:capping protein-inhibiting regulator of actin dynamics n=1 Tax=Drosophila takahashii TaxID=29030 RepID=UPI001CF8CE97|nr:trichohyalin [Drosophila takahashii]
MQRSVFKSTFLILLKRSFHLESSAPVAAKSSCLDLLGRLLQGRLNLLGGRPVPFRFLPIFKGDNRSLYFNADEDEEFRRRLAMQLKELREALQETQELRERQEDELQEELQLREQEEEEYHPYTTRSREISAEDLSEEELNEMRKLRMSSAGQDGRDQEGSTSGSSEQETSELEGEETAAEAREPQDPQEFEVREVREGDIEGVYWTGEGKRIVTQTPQRKTGHSGFIDGEGEEIPLEELPHHREDPSSSPPAPRAQDEGSRKSPSASDSDE